MAPRPPSWGSSPRTRRRAAPPPHLLLDLRPHPLLRLARQIENHQVGAALVGEEARIATALHPEDVDEGLGRWYEGVALEDGPLPLQIAQGGDEAEGHLLDGVGPLPTAAGAR